MLRGFYPAGLAALLRTRSPVFVHAPSREANSPASRKSRVLPLVTGEVELLAFCRGVFLWARAAQAVANGEHHAGEFENAGDGAAGIGSGHTEQGHSVGIHCVGAMVGGDPAEAHGVFATDQLDLHFIQHHPGRFLAVMLGIDRLPGAFEVGIQALLLDRISCRQ